MSTLGTRVRDRRIALNMTQGELAEKAGISYQAVQQIERGGGTKHILALSKALMVNPEWLERNTGVMEIADVSAPIPLPQSDLLDKLPVLGMAEGGDGWSLWNGDVVDYVPRPSTLRDARQAYAVYVVGSSMEPRYWPGELVYVHPGRPCTPGTFVLVQTQPEDGAETPRAVLKRLVRKTATKLVLEQYNPPKTFDIALAKVVSIHRIVGSGEA